GPGARRDRRRAQADGRGDLRHLRPLRRSNRRGAARGAAVGDALHRLQAPRGARVTEPAGRPVEPTRPLDIRVGSATDGLTPLSVAERSLAAGAWQWLGLLAVAGAALAADQLTKRLVTTRLDIDDATHVVGPLWIHHVQNSGIAFGLFASATPVVIVLT